TLLPPSSTLFPYTTLFRSVLSLGPWLGIAPTEADPDPFFSPDKVWLYQYVLLTGYLFCIPWYWIGGNRRWYWWSVVGSVTIIERSEEHTSELQSRENLVCR